MTSIAKAPLPRLDRWQVARHNDERHGYWLVIDALVYDVSEFMLTHPGGDRILQLYAGRDATHGFERVHSDRTRLAPLLERCRIGALREPACIAQADHAHHHAAFRAFDATLALVVEMQNALAVDHSFQLEAWGGTAAPATGRSRYELQRGLETHARFHREYLDVLVAEGLSRIASSTLPAHEVGPRLHAQLETLQQSPGYLTARAWALELIAQLERFTHDDLTAAVACFEVLDSWLLRAWKHELTRGLRVLERPHGASLQPVDSQYLDSLCDRLLEHLQEYFRSAGRVTVVRAGV